MTVKQMEVTEKKIGENTFYIKPFAAFTAVNISGDLAAVITPLLGGFAALLGAGDGKGENGEEPQEKKNIMDVDVNEALPVVSQAFSSISGEKFERLMKRRGKKRAIIAIARMILTAIYAMLSTGEVFNPCDLDKFDMPEELKKKRTLASAKEAVRLLVSLGVVPAGSISLDALAG